MNDWNESTYGFVIGTECIMVHDHKNIEPCGQQSAGIWKAFWMKCVITK